MLGRGRHASLGCTRRGCGENNAYLESIRTAFSSHSESQFLYLDIRVGSLGVDGFLGGRLPESSEVATLQLQLYLLGQ